jgi:single-strand DNA-binding protein
VQIEEGEIMANDLNMVALTGRLTRDIELKYSNGGMAIGKFSIAVNRGVKKGDRWESEASFFDCTMFGKSAENLSKYLNKGQQLAINGELQQERWEKDGQQRSRVSIIVQSVVLIGGEKSQNQSNSSQSTTTTPVREERHSEAGNDGYGSNPMFDSPDDQLPF